MRRISKFELEFSSEQKVKMPKGAEILSVLPSRRKVFIIAEFSDGATEMEERTIATYTTDSPLIVREAPNYVGTIVVEGVEYHVYSD